MLALIAGTGDLPLALVARLPVRPLVCAMAGFRPALTPDLIFRIEQLGSFLIALRDRGVTEVSMAGAVTRPPIDPSAIDEATKPLVPRIMAAIAQGDDGALRAIIAIFEEAGLTVKAAHEIAPDLLPPQGVLTRKPVTINNRQDAVTGEQTIAEMGQADVGQACIVRNGRVLAREQQAGTDAMLRPFAPSDDPLWGAVDGLGAVLGGAAEWLSGEDGEPTEARGAILFKAPKPAQDRRADLPVIGLETARMAIAAGFAGIVIEADGVMVLNLGAVLSALDNADLFLWVRPRGGA
ncbi:UDP-2,3-diacylglucosamine diphosphatase LpxI [Yoonia sp. GPGPB17]|uniref:LpxI family protein n=1 Tax=Yoonia sp. GPGPB17 TaxID=3026147 RepID=UPI0030BACE24